MKSSAKKVELASVDDLFSTEESRADAQRERVMEIPLSELHPFQNHPFKVKDDEAMMETADSIRQYGVLVPAIARPDPNGGYELVAGHRRHRASELAEKETMPVIVRDLDDDAATIIMVDSNLQRESLLPSERAFAYKMKLDAMKHQGARTDLTSAQVGPKLTAAEKIAENSPDSKSQIKRFIRLTELIPEATGGRTVYRQQKIDIHFNFIGNYYPPEETISEEERIAAIEADQLRKKQEKGKRAAERKKQKLEALRMAAEAGDPEAISKYEEHLANQRERNQKRRQKLKEAREADPEYLSQLEEKERIKREKMLETERKRMERASRKKKLTRAELKEKAKTDPVAAKEWEALKAREAEARQRKKEREEARMAVDPVYAAMMAERKAEYVRTRTAKRKAEHDALVELAKTDAEAARKLAEKRKYQSEATVRSYQKMKADAEAGDPEAIARYEAHLAKRREDYHKKKAEKEDIPA